MGGCPRACAGAKSNSCLETLLQHLATRVHELYFQPVHEEFPPRTNMGDVLDLPREEALGLARFDGDAPPIAVAGGTNAGISGTYAMLIGVSFPTGGCWELTAYHEGHVLTFVVSVANGE